MIELLDDSAEFDARAGALLESTVRNTVLATVLFAICAGRVYGPPPRFALVSDGSGTVIGAALRTPPRGLLCTELGPGEADALMERWLAADPKPPEINALAETARALAGAYRRLSGGHSELRTSMALHALGPAELRDPPRPAPGRLRRPVEAERDLVAAWGVAFVTDADLPQDPQEGAALVHRLIDDGRGYVWDNGGRAVSLVGHTPMIAGVPRVGPVYTPPECRRRGYAGTAVAALSARLFDAGARQVVLFTDLANPTSNKIYGEVGYRVIADWEQHTLRPAPPRAPAAS